jgi:hypothetical protein
MLRSLMVGLLNQIAVFVGSSYIIISIDKGGISGQYDRKFRWV